MGCADRARKTTKIFYLLYEIYTEILFSYPLRFHPYFAAVFFAPKILS
jgi:hypothetical protein